MTLYSKTVWNINVVSQFSVKTPQLALVVSAVLKNFNIDIASYLTDNQKGEMMTDHM